MSKNKIWANFNGPGKPITVKQIHEILANDFGIEPIRLDDGQWGYKREQFEEAWRIFLDTK